MSYYEGILVTNEDVPNVAAVGAEIDEDSMDSKIYMPSDTARRLEEGVKYTFSLTADPELFYRAALTGHDDPETTELSKDSLEREESFLYPKEATKTYFCRVESTKVITEKDEYGEARIKLVEGKVLGERGKGDHTDREDPLIDAMVHASRMYVADQDQRKAIREKVENILENDGSEVKRKVLDFVEGKTDEV